MAPNVTLLVPDERVLAVTGRADAFGGRLPWAAPTYRSNTSHGHWAKKAGKVAEVRRGSGLWARSVMRMLPVGVRSDVWLLWPAPSRARSDAGSLSPVLKAVIDGMVDAGVWPRDNQAFVRREVVGIEPPDPGGDYRLMLFVVPV